MLQHISQTRTLQRFTGHSQQRKKPSEQAVSGNILPFPTPGRKQHTFDWKDRLITDRQLWYIRLLASQHSISIQSLNNVCFRLYGTDLATMKRIDASKVIQSLKRQSKPLSKAIS
ncbi:MAG: hypothetical protein NDI81_17265 [Desulfobacula sp.]|nr:hypothetical protein [Desulfobacula sp.]